MYNNYNSNRPTDNLSVNTQYWADFSDTAKITVSGWNDKVSVRLNRASGKNADGLTMYNEQDYFNTALTKDVIQTLYDAINEEIIPAIKENKSQVSIAVQTSSNENGSNVIEILLADNDKGQLCVFLNAHKYGPAGPIDTYTHEFRQRNYLKGFNPMTNDGSSVNVQVKFMQFVEILKASLYPHAVKVHAEKYRNKIAEAYNANRGQGGNSYGNRNYQNNNSNNTTNYSAGVEYNPDGLENGLPFN